MSEDAKRITSAVLSVMSKGGDNLAIYQAVHKALAATPAVGLDAKTIDRAVMKELERQHDTGVKYLSGLNVDDLVAAIIAAQPASPLRGRELLVVGTRVRQSKVYAGTRDGTVKWSDDKEFTVVWDGVTVACTYDAAYLSKDALVECHIATITSPPEQPAAAPVTPTNLRQALIDQAKKPLDGETGV